MYMPALENLTNANERLLHKGCGDQHLLHMTPNHQVREEVLMMSVFSSAGLDFVGFFEVKVRFVQPQQDNEHMSTRTRARADILRRRGFQDGFCRSCSE